MNILVAGGAGFIGSHLIDALLAEGHRVICIDNFFIGTRENIAHLANEPQFVFYEQDLLDFEALTKVFEAEGVEHVFHLAANSDIQASAQNPMIEYQNTYSTTYFLLECMRLYGVKKLFFASTSAVYGEKDGSQVTEDNCLLEPISYYGGAKLGSEGMIHSYSYMNGFSTLVFRFPNVIGPRLTHGVVFDFIGRLCQDSSELRILGDGMQSKPYMHVMDLVDGIMRFKDVAEGVTTYNIGVESQTTVTRIADIVCREMGFTNVIYTYTGGRGGWRGDVPVFSYDLGKIHSAGWHAKLTSDETVEATVREVLACRR